MAITTQTALLVEKSLIEGKWRSEIDEFTAQLPIELAHLVVDGKFSQVLEHKEGRRFFQSPSSLNSSRSGRINDLLSPFAQGLEAELTRLAVAVACLHSFIQVNWTGPALDIKPVELLSDNSALTEEDLNRQSIEELCYGSEPAYHLAQVPTLFRLAQLLLEQPYDHITTIDWWRLRASSLHQHLLDEPVAFPTNILPHVDQLIKHLDGEPDLQGRLWIERGIAHHLVGSDTIAGENFINAARATGLQYEVSGALGRRTKFQHDAVTQLVLLAESRKRNDTVIDATSNDEEKPAVSEKPMQAEQKKDMPEALLLNDDTLLEHTKFTASSASAGALSHIDPQAQPALDPLDQCILLSLCLNVKNTSPVHGLTSEQMYAYVARVLSHPKNWTVYTMALLLRSRLEAKRTRTVERSTFQLQALIDQMPTSDSTLSERLLYFHSLILPSKWEMERELAVRYLSLGVVRSALDIFERLEMWEETVQCWQSLEKPEKGIAIVRDLLEGRKQEADVVLQRGKTTLEPQRPKLDKAREAKLWCLLGDLEKDKALEHYERAWEVSGGSSARSARSLGGYHFAQGNFKKAIPYLRRATQINPLYSRTWFVLGCTYIRTEEWVEAKMCFLRCVEIDQEDAESWSNLASMYLRMGEAGEKVELGSEDVPAEGEEEPKPEDKEALAGAIPFSNKLLAFRALKQGLRFSYENWRMWNNHMIVAVDVGELAEACRALGRVVEERAERDGESCVDMAVLERLVNAVTRVANNTVDGEDVRAARQNPNEGHGLKRRVTDLFTRIVLPRISNSARIWRMWARLLVWEGKWGEALDAHMNAYRAAVVSDERVEVDLENWKEAVGEVEEIVELMRNLGPRAAEEGKGGMKDWKFQAKSVVRTFMGRTKANFGDEPEWERLTELLVELRRAE
ncbi:TPR-like protein [Dacryopinax primogenitus]|uniref:TPR-like protein n=1 Tax=Dacryopinax primogenitus (strain DJM 731) TaxID=1858805 RepID=M5GH59_DACPD|nr:TPR-like protein [Dacryopinax primogenitus]EJU06668.1 TPR-like protein [Dacryopinax primogenitus]